MDSVPIDILHNILSNLHKSDRSFKIYDSRRIYNLRIVNKSFKNYIDNIKNLIYLNDRYNTNHYENMFNRLAYSGLYCNFEWLFNNNYHISINNINNLIIHYRHDIFELLMTYDNLKNMLFNRFNLFAFKDELDILSLSKSDNPLIIAGSHFTNKQSNLNIIKLLLNKNIKCNPFIHQVPELFQISIKHNNIILIKYLVTFYYSYIEHHVYKLTNYMMNSNNNEDLYFYLVQNDKIKISHQFLINCIRKKYNELFIYSCDKINHDYEYKCLISKIYEHNNTDLFIYLLKNIDNIDFLYIVDEMLNYKKMFKYISYLLNEYFDKLDKSSQFIKLCITNCIEKNVIKHLVDVGFKITIDDIRLCLDMEDIKLVEHLSKKYNSI